MKAYQKLHNKPCVYAFQVIFWMSGLCYVFGSSNAISASTAHSELDSTKDNAKLCLYISSYHPGYEWQDGVEEEIRAVLEGHCNIQQFYMDTKRNREPEFARKKALEAKALIIDSEPDVVITSDDNSALYLIKPHFKDAEIPFVFCGINWSVEEYGLPYSNATGMVEVGPYELLLREVIRVLREPKTGVYLGGDVKTTRINLRRFVGDAKQQDIVLQGQLVTNMAAWEKAYLDAQKSVDFIVIANHAGIADWDHQRATHFVKQHAGKLSVGYLEHMARYNMLSMTKLPQEQGAWAAQLALEILDGASPSDFPVVVNHRWNLYANPDLLEKSGHKLSDEIYRKAVKVSL